VKEGHGWAGLVLTPLGAEEGMGFEEGHYFFFSVLICIRLLTGLKYRLKSAWTH